MVNNYNNDSNECINEIFEEFIQRNRGRRSTAKRTKHKHHKKKLKLTEVKLRKFSTRRKISKALTGRQLSEKHKENISKSLSRKYVVTSPRGKIYYPLKLKEFCLKHGLDYKSLLDVSRQKLKQHKKGWLCHLHSDRPSKLNSKRIQQLPSLSHRRTL